MLQRGLAYAAATIMICAVGAAVLRLAVQILLSFSSPVVAIAATFVAAALLHAVRRRIRVVAKHRSAPRNPHSVQR
jgi:uncharacterized membrane protein